MTTNNGKSIEELAKEEQREYFRKWRAENKDKIKKSNQNYWLRRAARKALQSAENVAEGCNDGK